MTDLRGGLGGAWPAASCSSCLQEDSGLPLLGGDVGLHQELPHLQVVLEGLGGGGAARGQ